MLHCTAGPSGARYPTWAHWLAVSTLLRLEGPGLAARPRGPVTEDIFKGKKNKVHFSIGYKTRQLLLSIILHGIRSDPGLDCTVTEPSVILGMGLSVGYIFPAEVRSPPYTAPRCGRSCLATVHARRGAHRVPHGRGRIPASASS